MNKAEEAFAARTLAALHPLMAVTVLERTASHPAELDANRAARIAGPARQLLRTLLDNLRGAHGTGISRARAQDVYRMLGVANVCCELVRVPMTGVITAYTMASAFTAVATAADGASGGVAAAAAASATGARGAGGSTAAGAGTRGLRMADLVPHLTRNESNNSGADHREALHGSSAIVALTSSPQLTGRK